MNVAPPALVPAASRDDRSPRQLERWENLQRPSGTPLSFAPSPALSAPGYSQMLLGPAGDIRKSVLLQEISHWKQVMQPTVKA
jgi:hypothetical protein